MFGKNKDRIVVTPERNGMVLCEVEKQLGALLIVLAICQVLAPREVSDLTAIATHTSSAGDGEKQTAGGDELSCSLKVAERFPSRTWATGLVGGCIILPVRDAMRAQP